MDETKVKNEKANRSRVRLLFTQNGTIQVGSIGIAAFYVGLSYNTIDHWALACWAACYMTQFLVRMKYINVFKKKYGAATQGNATYDYHHWEAIVARCALASGLCWGAAASVMLPLADINYQAFMGFYLGGITAAGTMAYSASIMTARYFVTAALAPFIVAICFAKTPFHFEMAFLLCCYLALSNRLVKQLNASTIKSLYLTFDKESLIENLKDANIQLARSARMAALGEMAGGIAHEINNPLSVIRGKNQLIQFLIEEKQLTAETLSPLLANIDSTVMKIAKIVSGMKTLAHGGSGDAFTVTSVNLLISEIIELCDSRFKKSQIALECDLSGPDFEIECRPLQLSQVLLNLLNNAHDAVEDQPEKWVKISVEDDGDSLTISVIDSGAGVPDAIKGNLGNVTYTTKGIGKGTGLGLKISSNIVRDHNGTLTLDSAGNHTRFLIRLPKRQVIAQLVTAVA